MCALLFMSDGNICCVEELLMDVCLSFFWCFVQHFAGHQKWHLLGPAVMYPYSMVLVFGG